MTRVPRPVLPVLLVALATLAAPPAADPQPGGFRLPATWSEYRTPHYTLRTNASKEHAKELADFMELVHKTYTALLVKGAPLKTPTGGFVIVLFSGRKDFARAGMPAGAGAFYRPATRELVGYYHPVTMKPFFAHEGMHQFTDLTMPSFRHAGVPMWFVEGIADCIGNSVERDGRLYMCTLSGSIAAMRLPLIARLVREGKHIPLAKLVAMERGTFMRNASVCYAEAWSFCHFLMTYPKREEPGKQIPNGKYRPVISAFYEALLDRRTTAAEAWARALRAGRVTSIEALEAEWKAYILDLARPDPESAYLGVRPDGRAVEGAVIGGIQPGSPAAKGGLRKGDVVVRVDGRTVSLWNDFLAFLRTKRPGNRITLTVKRGARELKVPIVLEKRGAGR